MLSKSGGAMSSLSALEFDLAVFDELDAEAAVIRHRNADRKEEANYHSALLIRIDELKIAGQYQNKVERIRAVRDSLLSGMEFRDYTDSEWTSARELESDFQNFVRLKKSPKPGERRAAAAVAAQFNLDDMSLANAAPILAIARRATLHTGRPSLSPPWRSCAAQLDEVRLMIAEGGKLTPVCREIAQRHSAHDPEGKKLARHYRARMALRDFI